MKAVAAAQCLNILTVAKVVHADAALRCRRSGSRRRRRCHGRARRRRRTERLGNGLCNQALLFVVRLRDELCCWGVARGDRWASSIRTSSAAAAVLKRVVDCTGNVTLFVIVGVSCAFTVIA